MMQKPITKKTSTATKAAFISTVLLLIYEIFLLLGMVFVIAATGGFHCDSYNFSNCEQRNQFVNFFASIFGAVFGLGIPLFWLAANGFSIFVVRERQDGGKNLLIASLILNVLALGLFILFWLVVVIFSGL